MANVVMCPKCHTHLQPPVGAAIFACPCGLQLRQAVDTTSQPRQKSRNSSISSLSSKAHQMTGPPKYTPDSSRNSCERCKRGFSLLRRKHHCRNCGALVCDDCSRCKWPHTMLPPSYRMKEKEKWCRVCALCQRRMEMFRAALLDADLEAVQRVFSEGTIQLHNPYSIYPTKMYPVHCAAAGGSIECLQWLLWHGCSLNTRDAQNWTPLAHASDNDHLETCRWLVVEQGRSTTEISSVATLQRALHNAIILLPRSSSITVVHESTSRKKEQPYCLGNVTSDFPKTEAEEHELLRCALEASREMENLASSPSFLSSHPVMPPPPSYSAAVAAEKGTCLEVGAESSSSALHEDREKSIKQKAVLGDGNVEDDECVVCMDNPVDCVLVPCGHCCCCTSCANKISNTGCPVCRGAVKQVVKTFRA